LLLSATPCHVVTAFPPALPPRPHLKSTAPTYRKQFALQIAALFTVLFLALPYFALRDQALRWGLISTGTGLVALVYSTIGRQAWWWRVIHASFAPAAWAVSSLAITPGWFLAALVLTLLVFRGALEGRIPLFLTNNATTRALQRIAETRTELRFADLGAGLGGVVANLSTACPHAKVVGIENAPLTWLIGRLRTFRQSNARWLWGDFWLLELSEFDVVYAFLSPAPMSDLWEKAAREMRPGSTFISNSFPIPGLAADAIIEVEDARQTLLYCYHIAQVKDESRCEQPQPLPAFDL